MAETHPMPPTAHNQQAGLPSPPLSRLGEIDDITARPPRTHLAPLQPQALTSASVGATPGAQRGEPGAAPLLSPIRGARLSAMSSATTSPSKLPIDGGADVAFVGGLAMVARRRRQSSQTTSPAPPGSQSPEMESAEAYAEQYGHQPVPPDSACEFVRPGGSIGAPPRPNRAAVLDLLDPDTDGSPVW